MVTKIRWLVPLLLTLASVGIGSFVLVRFAAGGGTNANNGTSVAQSAILSNATIAPVTPSSFDRFPLTDFGPRLSENEMVSRSQIIVVGRLTGELGHELIPPTGQEAVTPDPSVPLQGLATTKFSMQVEGYVKGKGPDTLTLQVVDGFGSIPLDTRFLFFLVPYRPGTYQADIWSTVGDTGGKLGFLSGDAVEQVSVGTLNDYVNHVSAVVEKQATQPPAVALAVPAVLPNDTIIPAQLLGLQNTKEIQLTSPSKAVTTLSANDIAALLDWASQPMRVERANISPQAVTAHVSVLLNDGHRWEFEYDTGSQTLAFLPAGLQVRLSDSAQAILSSAIK